MNSSLIKNISVYVALFVLGAIFVYAFAPFNNYLLSFLFIPSLLFIHKSQKNRSLFRMSLVYFSGFFSATVYWIYYSMHVYGFLSQIEVAFVILGLALYLALFPAISLALVAKYTKPFSRFSLLVALPASWVLFEWLRGWLFTGFPWSLLGYTQTESIFSNLASLVGVHGLSALTLVIGGVFSLAFVKQEKLFWMLLALIFALGLFELFLVLEVIVGLVVCTLLFKRQLIVIIIPSLVAFTFLYSLIPWTERVPNGEIKVALLQGNINQSIKWKKPELSINRYVSLTSQVFADVKKGQEEKPDLIIWPETAIPKYYSSAKKSVIKKLQLLGAASNTEFIVGLPTGNLKADSDAAQMTYNSALKIGSKLQFYNKIHLVPFGEYSPYKDLLSNFYDALGIEMSNFSRGKERQKLMTIKDYQIGLFICYEIAFTGEVRQILPNAGFLVNLSNNAWFYDPKKHNKLLALDQFNAWTNDSTEAYQQIQMAKLRALETERYVVSVTNDGLTAIVDHKGKILNSLKRYTVGILRGKVEVRSGTTPFVFWGNYLILLLALTLILMMIYRSKKAAKI